MSPIEAMVRKFARIALAAGAIAILPALSQASDHESLIHEAGCASCEDCYGNGCEKPGFFKRMCRKWSAFDKEQLHPDHCWPEQYTRESDRRVNAPFAAQVIAGQRLETTIWEHYWATATEDGAAPQLNEAGRARLQYLARKRPYVIPQLELQTSFNSDLDHQRIAAVTEYAASVSTEPIAWNVVVTNRGKAIGLFGLEGPKTIDKMIGIAGQPPRYEPQVKQNFLQTNESSN